MRCVHQAAPNMLLPRTRHFCTCRDRRGNSPCLAKSSPYAGPSAGAEVTRFGKWHAWCLRVRVNAVSVCDMCMSVCCVTCACMCVTCACLCDMCMSACMCAVWHVHVCVRNATSVCYGERVTRREPMMPWLRTHGVNQIGASVKRHKIVCDPISADPISIGSTKLEHQNSKRPIQVIIV